MSSHIARDGRRRRVLHDEVRTHAGAQSSAAASSADAADAPRYGEMASIEHHPQISDYVPRRKRAVIATLVGGASVAAAAAATMHFAPTIAAAIPSATAEQIADQLAGGAIAWTSAVALLAIAGLARLVHSLRRHRVDDTRGRYRVWKWIVGGSIAASVNAVVGLHTIVAATAVAVTGWSLTAGGAEWWLAPVGIVAAWIAFRLVLETAESRSTVAFGVVAAICYAVAAAGALGWTPAPLADWTAALTIAVPLVGHAFALAAMMVFARYVVLDVQGLIDHAPRAAKPAKKPKTVETPATVAMTSAPATSPRREAEPAAESWDESDDGATDDDGQYLSKSDRKRLRKQQRRAA
jgi:hypothetical protein